jgi:hypothetical protein
MLSPRTACSSPSEAISSPAAAAAWSAARPARCPLRMVTFFAVGVHSDCAHSLALSASAVFPRRAGEAAWQVDARCQTLEQALLARQQPHHKCAPSAFPSIAPSGARRGLRNDIATAALGDCPCGLRRAFAVRARPPSTVTVELGSDPQLHLRLLSVASAHTRLSGPAATPWRRNWHLARPCSRARRRWRAGVSVSAGACLWQSVSQACPALAKQQVRPPKRCII